MNETRIQESSFQKVVLEGTAYEVGKKQGEWIQNDPRAVRFFTSPPEGQTYPTPKETEQMVNFFDKHCPGLNDEIRGFADSLEVPVEHMVYYPFSYPRGSNFDRSCGCSQMALLPSVTVDGHIYVGRNYEWSFRMISGSAPPVFMEKPLIWGFPYCSLVGLME